MKQLNLRHHHLMCSYTFIGIGYNQAFAENMTQIVSLLNSEADVTIHLQSHCDDLCAHCPNNEDGRCHTESSVQARDLEVSAFFGTKDDQILTLPEYKSIVSPKLKQLLSIDEVCQKCTFTSLCQNVLSEKILNSKKPSEN